MLEPSIFTRIINGEIPAYKIYEDDKVIAILDIHPINDGHTLLIPKRQIDHLWDMEEPDYDYLWKIAHRLGRYIRKVTEAPRVGVIVDGFGVPHAHIHLVPIYHGNEIQKPQDFNAVVDHESLAKVAAKLKM
ncbi:HIT domain-containing protein [Candidatus Saccharibacteria bacterium]|nr:HIT domain-containing protein [Candidatus Saccharibacteria bacterium]